MGSLDVMFDSLIIDSSWATLLAGFGLILIILFGAIAFFGKSGVEMGSYSIIIIVFLATLLVTAIGLFPAYILLIFLGVSLIIIVINKLFFSGGVDNG